MSPWNTVLEAPNPPPQWNPLQWDAIAQFYPWRVFYARSVRSGYIPLWNPHQFSGTPFLANGQSGVFYPPNLFFVIFGPITGLTIYALLHLVLASSFTYLLMRELKCSIGGSIIAAVTFSYSAFMVLWLELLSFPGAAVWLPLALMFVHRSIERRSIFQAMLCGLALSMSFLAGHFQIASYVAGAVGFFWLWQMVAVWRREGSLYALVRVIAPACVCFVIALAVAAPQTLPTLELGANSHRLRDITAEGYARFVSNGVPISRLITAFAPDFFGNPSRNTYYLLGNLDGHVGSAADYMEFGLYAGIVPLLLGVVAIRGVRQHREIGLFAALCTIAILTATGSPINAVFYHLLPGFSSLGGPNRVLVLYMFSLAVLAAFGADHFIEMVGASEGRRRLAALAAVGLPLIVIADLFAFGINYNPTCPRSYVYPKTALTTKLKQIAGNSRIAPINPRWSLYQTPNAILPPNAAMVYGLHDVQGYDSLYLKSYQSSMASIQGVDPSPPENGNMLLVRRPTSLLWQAAGIAVSRQPLPDDVPGAKILAEIEGSYIYALDEPEGYVVEFDRSHPGNAVRVWEAPGVCRFGSNPNRFRGEFMQGPDYPGWEMMYEGRYIPRWREVGLAPVPDRPQADFIFAPFTFRLGQFIMLVAVASICCVWNYRRMRRRAAR